MKTTEITESTEKGIFNSVSSVFQWLKSDLCSYGKKQYS